MMLIPCLRDAAFRLLLHAITFFRGYAADIDYAAAD